jgi:phage terminase large subunit GpA-like protein
MNISALRMSRFPSYWRMKTSMRSKKNVEVAYHTLSFMCKLTSALKPKENLTISEWANRNMMISAGANEEGHFNTRNMPHQEEIMKAISNPDVTDVTIMTSSQVGKTTLMLCGVGYYIDHEPSTQMIVLPTLAISERFSKTRLKSMIQDVAVLSNKISTLKTKNSDNTISYKAYPGGYLVLAGANSSASLAEIPARVIWMDEIDRFPDDVDGEGNPVRLAEKRATSYWNKKHIKSSTPTVAGKSKIEDEFNRGTMEEWCVQCPCCGTWQPYEFRRVIFDPVGMACVDCGEVIEERYWKESEHKWIAAHPERIHHRSFHMNELGSPLVAWTDIIESFQKANERWKRFHDYNELKTFINTVLGEVWDETEYGNEAATEESIMKRCEHYTADIPDGVIMLTAAVDVQDDRFEVEVRGWARNYETWGIYKSEIYGELERQEIWDRLEEYLATAFYFADGTSLNIAATAIDTGGSHTNAVYKWLKKMKKKGKTVYGVKGYSNSQPGIPLIKKHTKVDIKEKTPSGKDVVVDSTSIVILGVDSGKEDIMNHLTIETPGEGYCHFPSNAGRGYDEMYFKGLTSERKVEKYVRGKLKTVWVKKSGVRNEPLDLFNYNYAACMLRRPDWDSLEGKIGRGINYMKAAKKKTTTRRRSQGGMKY